MKTNSWPTILLLCRAIVYVIGSFIGNSAAASTVKVGVDGAWVGAMHGNSYIFFSVSPGEHHACVNRQSGFLTNPPINATLSAPAILAPYSYSCIVESPVTCMLDASSPSRRSVDSTSQGSLAGSNRPAACHSSRADRPLSPSRRKHTRLRRLRPRPGR